MPDPWISVAFQNGIMGLALLAVVYAVRAVWFRIWPHIDHFLKAWLKRYETTTHLLEKMQSTLAALTVQQAEIVQLIRDISGNERRERRAMQRLATMMEGRRCLFGVDIRKAIFGDSDEFDIDLEDSSDSDKPNNPKPSTR